ncbi:MAG: UDP-N-acetylmuramoyl-L-alanine--D-glutamate ligase [Candidatus Limnocylindria bacterium]|nr:UDP-N-acetylmuramoyl-L-alanine--D-glutamate ligase [Candidatus Limnocylindria bacterium]
MSGPDDLTGRRVAVVGLGKGRTAVALVRYLLRHGARVTVTDAKGPAQLGEGLARLAGLDVALALGLDAEAAAIEAADLVFRIPGVRADAPPLRRAAERGLAVQSEMELFFRLCPAPIVGITGTKGKTTTATLVAAMLEAAGRHVLLGGNIGNAVLDEVDRLGPDDLVVLELSSFQLEPLRRSPHVAVVTLTGEDHLDVHDTRAAYHAAKRNLLAWQGTGDVAVLNLDDPATVALHEGCVSEVRGFSLALRPPRGAHLDASRDLALVDGGRSVVLCAARELRVPGRHNVANALAAAVAADACGVPPESIAAVLRGFTGVAHRQEAVGEADGVLWVNNSQGTTPDSTIVALDSYERPAVVNLGGASKGSPFDAMARAIVGRGRGAVVIGRDAPLIVEALAAAIRDLGKSAFPVERALSLEEAVRCARAMALPGDVVILSPACTSFDMFSSYEERGDRFRAAVRGFAAPATP